MTRTFHRRFSLPSRCGVIIFALMAFYLFMVKAIVAALALVAVLVLIIERLLHTQYVFRDRTLYVERGRFARTIAIPVDAIYACRPMSNTFGLSRYLLLQYDHDHIQVVQPAEEEAFVAFLKRMQRHDEEEKEDDE